MELKQLGRVDYVPTYAVMQEFTSQRGPQGAQDVRDQLWICEHSPVFTQGLAGKPGNCCYGNERDENQATHIVATTEKIRRDANDAAQPGIHNAQQRSGRSPFGLPRRAAPGCCPSAR